MTVNRLSGRVAGCYVDGHWGQYGSARMIAVAAGFGWDDDVAIGIAERHMDSMQRFADPISDDEHEILTDAMDVAEGWLNEHVAPEGYSFGWHDGEYFLWSNDEWENES